MGWVRENAEVAKDECRARRVVFSGEVLSGELRGRAGGELGVMRSRSCPKCVGVNGAPGG